VSAKWQGAIKSKLHNKLIPASAQYRVKRGHFLPFWAMAAGTKEFFSFVNNIRNLINGARGHKKPGVSLGLQQKPRVLKLNPPKAKKVRSDHYDGNR